MNVLFNIMLFCIFPLQCMDHSGADPLLFIKNILTLETYLEKKSDQENKKESAASEYLQEANRFKKETMNELQGIISKRCLKKADLLSYTPGPSNTPLDAALRPFKSTLEQLFLAQQNRSCQAMEEMNIIILEVTKKLYHDAQKYTDFIPEFITEQIEKTIFTDSEKKTELSKSQQYYCVGLYHYCTGIYLKAMAKNGLNECTHYETALNNFCLSGNQLLTHLEQETHAQMIHQIVSHLLGIKDIIEKDSKTDFISEHPRFPCLNALLKTNWSNSLKRSLWRTLSQQAIQRNETVLQQFQERNKNL